MSKPMSDKAFKEARGELAFSQQLVDSMLRQPPQTAQQGAEMGAPTEEDEAPMQSEMPQEAPQQAPVPQETPAPQEVPMEQPSESTSPADFLASASKRMTDSFADITKFFMSNDEKQKEETKKREEKLIKEFKGIKEQIKSIVEE